MQSATIRGQEREAQPRTARRNPAWIDPLLTFKVRRGSTVGSAVHRGGQPAAPAIRVGCLELYEHWLRQDLRRRAYLPRQAPVTENQPPGGSPVPFVTNTIGAMHGFGRSTLPLNEASPLVVAGNGAVTRFTTTAAPSAID